jgi:hypothetical protein
VGPHHPKSRVAEDQEGSIVYAMTDFVPIDRAYAALDKAGAALQSLDANCCEPGRSPRMMALGSTLRSARWYLATIGPGDPEVTVKLIAKLEDAGAQIGSLQIDCCAPSRLPLYAEMLAKLNEVQRMARLASEQKMH